MAKINPNNEVVEETTETNSTLDKVLERLDSLEQENKELKAKVEKKENPHKQGRKVYKGPRLFSYRLWGNQPIISMKSGRKDKSKDLVYKNQFGQYVSNQEVELTLWNKKKVKVDINEFNASFGRSDKMEATDKEGNKITIDDLQRGQLPNILVFDTEKYGKLEISSKCIN